MNIGTATVKTLGKDGAFLTIPVDNPALGYDDWIALIANSLQDAEYIAGMPIVEGTGKGSGGTITAGLLSSSERSIQSISKSLSPSDDVKITSSMEAEPINLAYSLEVDAETNSIYIDFEDAGNANEAYEIKAYLVADLETETQ